MNFNLEGWSRLVLSNPSIADDALAFYRKGSAKHNGDFAPFSLIPVVFQSSVPKLFERSAHGIWLSSKKVMERFVLSPSFRKRFEMTERISQIAERCIVQAEGVSARDIADDALSFLRFDALMPPSVFGSDTLRICEINSNALGGMAESAFAQKALESVGAFSRLKDECGLEGMAGEIYKAWSDAILSRCRKIGADAWERARRQGRRPHICFLVLFDSGLEDTSELAALGMMLERDGGMEFSIADVRSLRPRKDGFLESGMALFGPSSSPIDFAFNYLISSDLLRREAECGTFFSSVFKAKTEIFPSPLCFLVQDKVFLSLLLELAEDDSCDVLDESDRAFIKGEDCAVLKSFKIGKDTANSVLDDLETHKDEFVVKPSALYGGKGVRFGRDCSRQEWKRIIRGGMETGSHVVVQRVCKGRKILSAGLFPSLSLPVKMPEIKWMNAVIGLFCISGKYAGTYVRVSESDVVSSENGTCVCAAYALTK